MADYTLRIRRFSPETGQAPFWQDYDVDLDGHRSVLDGILQAKDREDASIGIRCSCRAAICGSCGVRINGRPNLACHTHLDKAAETALDGIIVVEPMGNMPVLKDLIVDMDAVHWKKIQRVTPWLIPDGDGARARVHRAAGVDDRRHAVDGLHPVRRLCLGLPVDGGRPAVHRARGAGQGVSLRRRPARRPAVQRLKDLSEDPHGIYDCTHCFNCIEACPKGVAPMSQIMRLRRIAGGDHEINDRNNGHRHEMAFVKNVEKNGLLHEADLLPDSFGGKFHPRAVPELGRSLPVILTALRRGKVTPKKALLHEHKAPPEVKRLFKHVHDKSERYELNLYVVGEEEETGETRCTPTRPAAICRRRGARTSEGRLLARLREPRLHAGAARLDGQGRAAARHRARRARPRELLRRGRDRRAQPGARRHAQRAHLRARPAGRRRRADDEHLLHLPGRAVGVPGAARREHGVPRPRQRDAQRRGADVRARAHQQAPAVADGRGDRPRHGRRQGRAPAHRPARRPVLRLLHRPPDGPPRDRPRASARHVPAPADRGARRHRGRLRRPVQVLRLPDHHDEPRDVADPGRPASRRRAGRGRRLPRHALPAVPPQPRPAAAAGREGRRPRRSACRSCTCPS